MIELRSAKISLSTYVSPNIAASKVIMSAIEANPYVDDYGIDYRPETRKHSIYVISDGFSSRYEIEDHRLQDETATLVDFFSDLRCVPSESIQKIAEGMIEELERRDSEGDPWY